MEKIVWTTRGYVLERNSAMANTPLMKTESLSNPVSLTYLYPAVSANESLVRDFIKNNLEEQVLEGRVNAYLMTEEINNMSVKIVVQFYKISPS